MSELIVSWIENANDPEGPFPLNNLPYGVARIDGDRICCTAIGNHAVRLDLLLDAGILSGVPNGVFSEGTFNRLMEAGPSVWNALRTALQSLLRAGGVSSLRDDQPLQRNAFVDLADLSMLMPFEVTEFTDFFSGRHHAENASKINRGADATLPPSWLHMPIAYNGRASTVVVSGTNIHRPNGQLKLPDKATPSFGACRRLDIELEMGAIVGVNTEMGQPVTALQAEDMIFGFVILNDWSARDIQAWEYQPLGPFQAKAFATTISPWIVTAEALKPLRRPLPEREHELLPYLTVEEGGVYDIALEIEMKPAESTDGTIISRTNHRELYYSAAQQLAHHSGSGCAMRVGDLLGSGTISGPTRASCGALLEISWGGLEPITLDCGSERTFIEDGDCMTMRGHGVGNGYRIGFGDCRGTILPAVPFPAAG